MFSTHSKSWSSAGSLDRKVRVRYCLKLFPLQSHSPSQKWNQRVSYATLSHGAMDVPSMFDQLDGLDHIVVVGL